jgi:phytoene desaturase
MTTTATVIGSGFSSLAAATTLADRGVKVTVLEKNASPGGRARKFEANGFMFDMGPSWYWMPDVFEQYFERFGKAPSDYYTLKRLDPSYRVFFRDEKMDMPASMDGLRALFEEREKGAGKKLDAFLRDAAIKYDAGIHDLVHRPSLSVFEFMEWKVMKGLVQLDLFSNFHSFARKYFNDPKLLSIIEFPVLFLGAMPQETPALYSLMNYADLQLGTWYPMGGMHKIVEGMVKLAEEKGVQFRFNEQVDRISKNGAMHVHSSSGDFRSDYVVGGADYAHIDQRLLDPKDRQYSATYWDKRVMAPSSLLYYVGVQKRIDGIQHHNLFFDADFEKHATEIYKSKTWPNDPLFYVCAPSVTDPSVAPEGHENLFILIPVAAGIQGDDEQVREHYFNQVADRIQAHTGTDIRAHLAYKRSYAVTDFEKDYHAFKGNAYGLANTLLQTAFLKPRIQHKHIKELYFTGQLTAPGPGVPPALISGQVVGDHIVKQIERTRP